AASTTTSLRTRVGSRNCEVESGILECNGSPSKSELIVIFFATFGAVFIAEIVGDKLLYTTGVLAARYRTWPIMLGMASAFMPKMGVAVPGGVSGSTTSHI